MVADKRRAQPGSLHLRHFTLAHCTATANGYLLKFQGPSLLTTHSNEAHVTLMHTYMALPEKLVHLTPYQSDSF